MSAGEKKESSKIIIVLAVALAIGVVTLIIALISFFSNEADDKGETSYQTTQSQTESNTDKTTQGHYVNIDGEMVYVPPVSETQAASSTTSAKQQQGEAEVNSTAQVITTGSNGETSVIDYYESLSPNGENKLSDDPDNYFIKLISSKYKVEPELLVAIYSVPDTGVNYVLEFAGSRDSSGNIIKSPDTLSKLYYIDIDGNVQVATRTGIGNEGVDAISGRVTMEFVKEIVMTQYPNYFTGLE